jgi:hypothetical protein
MSYLKTIIVLTALIASFASAGPRTLLTSQSSINFSGEHNERSKEGSVVTNADETDPTPAQPEKTPCEILKEKMEEAAGDEGTDQNLYGGVGCHDGEVLICVYPEGFVQAGDDPHGSAIVSACISAHEHHHGQQAECDPNGTGVYPPENDLKCDESETPALAAEIDCYESQSCPSGTAGDDCRTLVKTFKDEACEQYETAKGSAHPSC